MVILMDIGEMIRYRSGSGEDRALGGTRDLFVVYGHGEKIKSLRVNIPEPVDLSLILTLCNQGHSSNY